MADDKTNDKAEAFIKEVEDELRREQLEKLWEQYGVYAIAVAALIVVGVGGWRFMETRRVSAAGEVGAAYSDATRLMEQQKTDEAIKAYEALSKTSHAGYAVLAKLRVAGEMGRKGRTKEAIALFDQIAADPTDRMLASFASLQSAMLMVDTASWTEVETRLKPVVEGTSPWRHSARETLALAAMRAGRTNDARRNLERVIADQTAPPALIERARTLMAIITEGELAKRAPKAEAPKAAPTPTPVKSPDPAPAVVPAPMPAPVPAPAPGAKSEPPKTDDGKPTPAPDGKPKQ